MMVGTTAGLGNALVMANLGQLDALLGVSERQAAWIPTAHVMSNLSANLVLIKFRQQFGLRLFTLLFLTLHAVLSLAQVVVTELWLVLAVRAASGMVGGH